MKPSDCPPFLHQQVHDFDEERVRERWNVTLDSRASSRE
jgi:hypothetical protein